MTYKEQRQIDWTKLSDRWGFSPHVLMMYDMTDGDTLVIKNSNTVIFVNTDDIEQIDERDEDYVIHTKQRTHIHLGKSTPEIHIHIL